MKLVASIISDCFSNLLKWLLERLFITLMQSWSGFCHLQAHRVWGCLHEATARLFAAGLVLLGGSKLQQWRIPAGWGEVHLAGRDRVISGGGNLDFWLSWSDWHLCCNRRLFFHRRRRSWVFVEFSSCSLPFQVSQGLVGFLSAHAVNSVALCRRRCGRRAELIGGAAIHETTSSPKLSRDGGGQRNGRLPVAYRRSDFPVSRLQFLQARCCCSSSNLETRDTIKRASRTLRIRLNEVWNHHRGVLVQLVVRLSVFIVVVWFRLPVALLPHDGFLLVFPSVQAGALIHADPTHHLTEETHEEQSEEVWTSMCLVALWFNP